MRLKDIVPATLVALALLGLALSNAAADKPAPKAEPAPDDKAIARLIEQLGSDTFEDREAAQKALDAIGAPALKALQEASKAGDAEVRKRAAALAERISTRAVTAEVLAPKMVHLVYKNTPIKEAIADFEKKAGVPFNLIDPKEKLKDKKITLDTGKVTFWQALEKFCDAAGLVEADPSTLEPVPFPMGRPGVEVPPPPAIPVPMPGVIRPMVGGGAAGAAGGVKKLIDEEIKKRKIVEENTRKELEKSRKELEEKLRKELEEKLKGGVGAAPAGKPAVAVAVAVAAEAKPAPAVKPDADAPVVNPAPGIAVPLPPMVVPVPPDAGGGFPGNPGGMPFVQPFQHGKINLVPGKPVKTPSDLSTSVRVRQAPASVHNPFGKPDEKVYSLILQAAPELRLRWQELVAVNIDKAVDEHGQNLTKYAPPMPMGGMGGGPAIGGPGGVIVFPGIGIAPGFPGMGPGLHVWSNDQVNYNTLLLLNKGEKASTKLKELSGNITARFLGEARPHIVADNIMKAAGKTFKGAKSGSITVKKVSKAADGTITVAFEFEQPADVIPEGGFNGGMGVDDLPVAPMPAPPIRIRPGIRRPGKVIPPPAVKEAPAEDKPAEGKAEPKAEDKPAKAEAKAEARAEVVVEVKGGAGVAVPGVALPGVAIGGPAIALPPMVGGGGIAIGPDGRPMMFVNQGISLQDDKGNILSAHVQIDWAKARAGGALGAKPVMEYLAVYKPKKGQPAEPSKLVFTGRTSIQVNVPFKLENVTLK
jgi:hypothetical protein